MQLDCRYNAPKFRTDSAKSMNATSRNGPRNSIDDGQTVQTLAEIQLRQASVRITKARLKVLMALLEAKRAFSHHEVQDRFADMDRVTLYRTLDCLIEAGLAHKIAGDDRVFRYSAGTDHSQQHGTPETTTKVMQHQHGHFKCTRCARVFCLDKGFDARLASGGKRRHEARQQLQDEVHKMLGDGFLSHDIELTIKGWCADCAH